MAGVNIGSFDGFDDTSGIEQGKLVFAGYDINTSSTVSYDITRLGLFTATGSGQMIGGTGQAINVEIANTLASVELTANTTIEEITGFLELGQVAWIKVKRNGFTFSFNPISGFVPVVSMAGVTTNSSIAYYRVTFVDSLYGVYAIEGFGFES